MWQRLWHLLMCGSTLFAALGVGRPPCDVAPDMSRVPGTHATASMTHAPHRGEDCHGPAGRHAGHAAAGCRLMPGCAMPVLAPAAVVVIAVSSPIRPLVPAAAGAPPSPHFPPDSPPPRA